MQRSGNGVHEGKRSKSPPPALLTPTAAEVREHARLPPVTADTLASAWPAIDPDHVPCGEHIVVQLRTAKARTAGGIYLPDDAREAEKWNTQIAKVVAIGPLAFRNRTTFEPWSEGPWFKLGDFVRVPLYAGDRYDKPIPGRRGEFALFTIFRETDVRAVFTGDPLAQKAYI